LLFNFLLGDQSGSDDDNNNDVIFVNIKIMPIFTAQNSGYNKHQKIEQDHSENGSGCIPKSNGDFLAQRYICDKEICVNTRSVFSTRDMS